MYDVIFMKVLKSETDLVENWKTLLLTKFLLPSDQFKEVPLPAAFENNENLRIVFNHFDDFHDVWVIQRLLERDFQLDVFFRFVLGNSSFRDLQFMV